VKTALLVVLAQAAAAWYGAGFIWTMQILNYPLLSRIGASSFAAYETAHNQRFAAVVAPGVVVVLTTTVLLFFVRPPAVPAAAPIAAAFLIGVILVSTVLWQAPAHGRLATGFDAAVHATLVRTNWIRTAAWTALGLLDTWMLYASAKP
jgi:hypothetical protein